MVYKWWVNFRCSFVSTARRKFHPKAPICVCTSANDVSCIYESIINCKLITWCIYLRTTTFLCPNTFRYQIIIRFTKKKQVIHERWLIYLIAWCQTPKHTYFRHNLLRQFFYINVRHISRLLLNLIACHIKYTFSNLPHNVGGYNFHAGRF